MKKKGFTLIELLAVIVILAVIALISMPLVLNTIDKAKKGAAEESANSYVSAIETAIVSDMMNSNYNYNPEQTFILSDNGKKIVNGEKELEINIKGTYPTSGSVVIKNAIVKSAELKVSGYDITYSAKAPVYTKYSNGTAIYYNPETNTKCSSSEAVSTTETKTGCMKWYTFNDTASSNTVNMILDHNTTALVQYNSNGNNKEALEINNALISDTETWNKSLNPRLISAYEIAEIVGNVSFEGATSYYLTGSLSNGLGTSKYSWLYDYTYKCTELGCNIYDNNTYNVRYTSNTNVIMGYWTNTAYSLSNINTYYLSKYGQIDFNVANSRTDMGLRPVVTLSKSVIE